MSSFTTLPNNPVTVEDNDYRWVVHAPQTNWTVPEEVGRHIFVVPRTKTTWYVPRN